MECESLASPSERESGDQLASPAVWNSKQNYFLVLMNETSNFLAKRLQFNSSSRIYCKVHHRATELSGMGLLLFSDIIAHAVLSVFRRRCSDL